MSETQAPCIIIPGHWIGHFIGRSGSFAAKIRRTYRVSYNIETTNNDQGHKIGEIYIQGRNFAAAKAALCAEASRLNEIDERERANSKRQQRPHSSVSTDDTPQRVPSGSTQSFPPLPTKAGYESPPAQPSKTWTNPREDVTHKMQPIDRLQTSLSATAVCAQLREALAAEQSKVANLVAKNTLLCTLLHQERGIKKSTLVIRGIPKVRMTGEPLCEDAMSDALSKAGDITSLHLSDAIGSGDRQVCYVTFKTRRTAEKVQEMLNGNKIEGCVICVSFFVTRWNNTQ
jgi:hypothetical protein